eukprot:12939845-Ditylum_brightwellii.AAC.1
MAEPSTKVEQKEDIVPELRQANDSDWPCCKRHRQEGWVGTRQLVWRLGLWAGQQAKGQETG